MSYHRNTISINGSSLWYIIGLITTDGSLSKDGRHIDITSKDYHFLEIIKEIMCITNKIESKHGGYTNREYYHIQIGNKNLYEFLLSIGITPRKSLTIGQIKVPDKSFADFLRGVIDGNGSIIRSIHTSNKVEQWRLSIASGSEKFVIWLHSIILQLLNVSGSIRHDKTNSWKLKYGKLAAKEILRQCYYKDCLGLERKIKLAQQCLNSRIVWNKSVTTNIALVLK